MLVIVYSGGSVFIYVPHFAAKYQRLPLTKKRNGLTDTSRITIMISSINISKRIGKQRRLRVLISGFSGDRGRRICHLLLRHATGN